MIGAVSQKPRQAVVEILDLMRSRDLALGQALHDALEKVIREAIAGEAGAP
jgi:hypothetical protein